MVPEAYPVLAVKLRVCKIGFAKLRRGAQRLARPPELEGPGSGSVFFAKVLAVLVFELARERHSPDIFPGLDAPDSNLVLFWGPRLANPRHTEPGAAASAFNANHHAALQRAPDAFQTRAYRREVYRMRFDLKETAVDVHSP
jgi:hypothetical protein